MRATLPLTLLPIIVMMQPCPLIPATHDRRFGRVFAWWVRRMLRSDFAAVRLRPGARGVLEDLARHDGPAAVLLTHGSWWDPLIGIFLADAFMPVRQGCGPIDAAMLRKFGFFRKLGLFGIDPDHPDAAQVMRAHVLEIFASQTRPTLWITAQGRFVDPRGELELRPGAASVCAGATNAKAACVAIEYPFLLERKPEVVVHAVAVQTPARPSTAHWHRAMTQAMDTARRELANDVTARDVSAHETLVSRATSVNPIYELWRTLRGGDAKVTQDHRAGRGA